MRSNGAIKRGRIELRDARCQLVSSATVSVGLGGVVEDWG